MKTRTDKEQAEYLRQKIEVNYSHIEYASI